MPPPAGSRETILFVCTQNLSRSYTAEYLFRESSGYEVRSAGTSESARVPVSVDLIAWAARIFVMEEDHLMFLRERFGEALLEKEVVCLEIPDIYAPLEPALVAILREKLAGYLGEP
jgi:predicted protein tyrosine phosphatase